MSDSEEASQTISSKKRLRNPSEWKREKRKRLRVAGKEYINSKGHVVGERRMGNDCKCRRKCYLNISEENRKQLFHGYYSLKSHDEQNAYLFGLIRRQDIARKRSKNSDRRSCTYKYFLRLKGSEIQVCRLAFANIHGISPHKIRILCQKLDRNVMFPSDGRGKHDNRPKKIASSIVNNIKAHIYSIIKSDKVREFLKEMKNTGAELNITKMWKDYLKKYDPNFKGYSSNISDKPVHAQYESLSSFSVQEKRLFNLDELSSVPMCRNDELNINTYNIEQPLQHNISAGLTQSNLLHNNNSLLYHHNHHGISKNVESPTYSAFQDSDNLEDLDGTVNNQHYGDNSSQFLGSSEEEDRGVEEQKSASPKPIVKQWLYSKVFHDEFHDYVSLKKRLLDKLKTGPESAVKGQQKAERKQRLPKKIPRDKATSTNKSCAQFSTELTNAHNLQQNHTVTQSEMYLLPANTHSVPSSLSQLGQSTTHMTEITHVPLNFPLQLNQGPGALHLNLPTFPSNQHCGLSSLSSVHSNEELGNYEPITCPATVTLSNMQGMGISNGTCQYLHVSDNFYE